MRIRPKDARGHLFLIGDQIIAAKYFSCCRSNGLSAQESLQSSVSMQISRRYGRSEAWSSHVQLVMSKEKKENDVNQDFGREHEHPHGQSLPHAPLPSANPQREKRQGKSGQSNFIPGEAPVGWPGRTKPFKKPGK
jgi:hypothetical protein